MSELYKDKRVNPEGLSHRQKQVMCLVTVTRFQSSTTKVDFTQMIIQHNNRLFSLNFDPLQWQALEIRYKGHEIYLALQQPWRWVHDPIHVMSHAK